MIMPTAGSQTNTLPISHVMLKPRGPICNLDCAYCYYLSKERLYPGSGFRMSDDLLEEFTRQYIEAQRVPEVTFAWQAGEKVADRLMTGRQYGDFLIAIFDEWGRRDVGRIFVQIFEVALAAWLGQRPGLCIFDQTCGTALAMEHNGHLYSCDHFLEP